jgi:septal ring factor EnvC (AmiA/AmiB activator)
MTINELKQSMEQSGNYKIPLSKPLSKPHAVVLIFSALVLSACPLFNAPEWLCDTLGYFLGIPVSLIILTLIIRAVSSALAPFAEKQIVQERIAEASEAAKQASKESEAMKRKLESVKTELEALQTELSFVSKERDAWEQDTRHLKNLISQLNDQIAELQASLPPASPLPYKIYRAALSAAERDEQISQHPEFASDIERLYAKEINDILNDENNKENQP